MKEIKHNKFKGNKLSVFFLLVLFTGIFCGALFSECTANGYALISVFSYKLTSENFIYSFIYSLLPVFIYLLLGLFCSVSLIGFILIPCECFVIGFTLAVSLYEAGLIIGNYVYYLYLPFWSFYTVFLVEYIRCSFKSSLNLFYGFTDNKQTDELKAILKGNIKIFYYAAFVSIFYTFLLVSIGFGINNINY